MRTESEDSWMPALPQVESSRPVRGLWLKDFIASQAAPMVAIDWGNWHKGLCLHDEHEHQCHYIVAGARET
jgi:hypothetical protein